MRLDKFVADAAQLTRSVARALISRGRVTVNGQVCKKADLALQTGDAVCADGKSLVCEEYVYIMVNKPAGVVSASADGRDKTVVDLLNGAFPRRQLFPAGRLDKASTGFVLLTDDGAFAHDILAPKRHVPKTYHVVLDTPVTPAMAEAFAAGVTLADGQRMQPARLIPDETDPFAATVVLRQGVYHQIKRMFGVLGAGVNGLHRTAIGGLSLDESLAPGAWRLLTPAEKTRLQTGGE
ncbi:MAG TPA: rRNA pseudouridine synthase [Candidatus Fournierella merdigallinarum]|nr:rRNA pseudouridine synthase [Candidatus Fournierella merdigallinarum]